MDISLLIEIVEEEIQDRLETQGRSDTPEDYNQEIEDLNTILRKLKTNSPIGVCFEKEEVVWISQLVKNHIESNS